MMSLQQIRSIADQQARTARRHGKKPLLVADHDRGVLDQHLRAIPFLGDYVPRGWERVNASLVSQQMGRNSRGHVPFSGPEALHFLEVDKSGWGAPDELALTYGQFCQWASEAPGEYGYAIVEEGQFQVVIGVYRRKSH